MIIPDVNLLLYATIDAFGQHERARHWWEEQLSGGADMDDVGLAPVCALGFLRIATSRRVFATPLTAAAAVAAIESWLAQPCVRVLSTDGDHLGTVLRLLAATGTAGDLTTDAQIAAHALTHHATVATNDTDFGRFPGVRTINPMAG